MTGGRKIRVNFMVKALLASQILVRNDRWSSNSVVVKFRFHCNVITLKIILVLAFRLGLRFGFGRAAAGGRGETNSAGLYLKFNVWPPDLVFVTDDWILHKQLTAVDVCVRICARVHVYVLVGA